MVQSAAEGLTVIVLIIGYLNIFDQKLLHVIQQKLPSYRDVILTITQNDLECSEKQIAIQKRIKEHCSKTQVCLFKSTIIFMYLFSGVIYMPELLL